MEIEEVFHIKEFESALKILTDSACYRGECQGKVCNTNSECVNNALEVQLKSLNWINYLEDKFEGEKIPNEEAQRYTQDVSKAIREMRRFEKNGHVANYLRQMDLRIDRARGIYSW